LLRLPVQGRNHVARIDIDFGFGLSPRTKVLCARVTAPHAVPSAARVCDVQVSRSAPENPALTGGLRVALLLGNVFAAPDSVAGAKAVRTPDDSEEIQDEETCGCFFSADAGLSRGATASAAVDRAVSTGPSTSMELCPRNLWSRRDLILPRESESGRSRRPRRESTR